VPEDNQARPKHVGYGRFETRISNTYITAVRRLSKCLCWWDYLHINFKL